MKLYNSLTQKEFYFLPDNSEVAGVISNTDWQLTSIGPVNQWPISLRSTLNIMMASKTPAILYWGNEYIQFFNDAFLSDFASVVTHHDIGAEGKKANNKWKIFDPAESRIQDNETNLRKDSVFAYTKEKRLNNKFWSFNYNPVFGDTGDREGVLIVCSEINYRAWQLHALVDSAPFPIGVYEGSEMRITLVNQSIIDVWGKGPDVVGKTYFDVLPELENQEIYPQLLSVFYDGIPFHAFNQRVDLTVQNKLQTFYFNYSFTPLFDESGEVYGVMNTAADVTDLNLAKLAMEQSEKNFRNLILQAPVAMCLLLGPLHNVEVANDAIIKLWGKQKADVLQKPIFEGLPDARQQGLEQLLDQVFEKGEEFISNERPVHLVRYGNPELVYLNFIYTPYRDGSGEILGVIAIANDVTEQVLARQKVEELVKIRTHQLVSANESPGTL